jgi:hypothetical protein
MSRRALVTPGSETIGSLPGFATSEPIARDELHRFAGTNRLASRSTAAVRDAKSHRAVARDVATIATRSILNRQIDLAESIVYLCALIANQPRAIDRYIDYFGETRSVGGMAP